jgi:tetratricopeptide (TPR) repeat protein
MHSTSSAETWISRARVASGRKAWQEALDAFDACMSMDEKYNADANCLHDRSICLFHLDRKQEALEGLNLAVELDPDYSYRYASRAWMRNATGDIHGAIEDYKRAIELDPEDAIAHNNLGLLEEQLGYRSQAKERFDIADELSGILQERGIALDEDVAPADLASNEAPVEEPVTSWVKIARDALLTKKGRQEFLNFIRNGFKL